MHINFPEGFPVQTRARVDAAIAEAEAAFQSDPMRGGVAVFRFLATCVLSFAKAECDVARERGWLGEKIERDVRKSFQQLAIRAYRDKYRRYAGGNYLEWEFSEAAWKEIERSPGWREYLGERAAIDHAIASGEIPPEPVSVKQGGVLSGATLKQMEDYRKNYASPQFRAAFPESFLSTFSEHPSEAAAPAPAVIVSAVEATDSGEGSPDIETQTGRRALVHKRQLTHKERYGWKPTYKQLAKKANPGWNTKDPIAKWIAGDPRYLNDACTAKILSVLRSDDELPRDDQLS